MTLKGTLKEAVLEAKRSTEKLYDGKLLWLSEAMMHLTYCIAPEDFFINMMKEGIPRMTVGSSNMAASRECLWEFDGKKAHWVAL